MSLSEASEEFYEQHVRTVCFQCGHAFVWHGIGVGNPDNPYYVPEGCGVRGCTCNLIDPGDF